MKPLNKELANNHSFSAISIIVRDVSQDVRNTIHHDWMKNLRFLRVLQGQLSTDTENDFLQKHWL